MKYSSGSESGYEGDVDSTDSEREEEEMYDIKSAEYYWKKDQKLKEKIIRKKEMREGFSKKTKEGKTQPKVTGIPRTQLFKKSAPENLKKINQEIYDLEMERKENRMEYEENYENEWGNLKDEMQEYRSIGKGILKETEETESSDRSEIGEDFF